MANSRQPFCIGGRNRIPREPQYFGRKTCNPRQKRFYKIYKSVTISFDTISKDLKIKIQPVAYGSRDRTKAPSRYAQTDRQMLAMVYDCEKNDHIYVRRDVIETDHQPSCNL